MVRSARVYLEEREWQDYPPLHARDLRRWQFPPVLWSVSVCKNSFSAGTRSRHASS